MNNIDTNKLANFALHWLFAGFWAFFGWALATWVNGFIPWPA